MMKKRAAQAGKYIVCIILSLIVLLPFYMVLINSFKTKGQAAKMSLAFPEVWRFDNYLHVIDQGKLVTGFVNSMTYAFVATTVGVVGCAMAAYVMSRNRTRLHRLLYYFTICGLFFPVNYVTLVNVMTVLGLHNTKAGIISVFIGAMVPFCIFTIYSFVSAIPSELDEAAIIDGAGPVSLFFRVIFPLMKPTVVTCYILQFMGVWSNFLTPLYLSNSSRLSPMTMSVYQFFGKNQNQWQYIFADIILTIIPVIIVYAIGQRYMISGMTSGAVKQ